MALNILNCFFFFKTSSHLCDLMLYLSSLYVDNRIQIYCEHSWEELLQYIQFYHTYTLKTDSYLTVNRFSVELLRPSIKSTTINR